MSTKRLMNVGSRIVLGTQISLFNQFCPLICLVLIWLWIAYFNMLFSSFFFFNSMNSYFVFNWTVKLLWFFSPYALWSNSLQWLLQLLFVVSLSYSAFFFCYALWSILLFKYRFLTFFTRYDTSVFCKKSYWIKLIDGRESNVVRYIE